MIPVKELNHVFLTIPKELKEALSRKSHGYYSVSDIAEIKIEPAVLVSIPVPGHHLFDDRALS